METQARPNSPSATPGSERDSALDCIEHWRLTDWRLIFADIVKEFVPVHDRLFLAVAVPAERQVRVSAVPASWIALGRDHAWPPAESSAGPALLRANQMASSGASARPAAYAASNAASPISARSRSWSAARNRASR